MDPLNAVVTALDETPGTAGPLAGWRIGVKDNVAVAGVRCTRGSAFFAEHVATADAAVVTRLRASGAGITATLNMAEFALGVTSQNSVHGGVVNPWDPRRIPGGSSGGSGAAVAAGYVDAALGTDTGGSVRLPAAMCGVTGLRPTYGTVPEDGVFPCCPETGATGPLTRTAAQAGLLAAVLSGRGPVAPEPRPPDVVGVVALAGAVDAGHGAQRPVEVTGMDFGVFIPIANNGWLISENAPQYMPTFDLNKRVVQEAERQGFAFALSMVKLRGFGGKTEFWDHALESFTLMAGLAACTERIKLYASTAVLTLPPAVVARMATTIDQIAPGRFGINIVSGWASGEYTQMGLWPGDEYFGHRYDYSSEYVRVMRDLWETGHSDLDGRFFHMEDCVLSPRPSSKIDIVCAGQSERGMKFCAEYGDYNFILSPGINDPEVYREPTERLAAAAAESGRDVGSLPLFMAIMADTDEEAQARWASYHAGADLGALGYMADEGSKDANAAEGGTAKTINLPDGAVNFNMATLVGSYETVARQIDQVATMKGVEGMMFTFDDFERGTRDFGEKVMPLLG